MCPEAGCCISTPLFFYLLLFSQFFKAAINYKRCGYEGREISASSKSCSVLCGIFCIRCSILKRIACGTHFIFLHLQVHFPDVERVEWLNKVRSSELQFLRPSALSWIPAQTPLAKPDKIITSPQEVTTISVSVFKSWSRQSCHRLWWKPSVCLADVGLINLTTALVRFKNKTKLHVCTYAYLCEYIITLANVVVFPLAREVPGKLCARCSYQE